MANVALRKAEKLQPWTGPVVPHPNYRWWKTNQYRAQRRASVVDTFVVHATAGGSSAGAMSVPASGKQASWHWLIPDEDEPGHGEFIYRCVPDSGAAWHVLNNIAHPADDRTQINDRSFGVEVVNRQDGRDPFSDWQLRVAAALVRYAWSHYPIRYLYTHAYLDPRRKSDPGNQFDWAKFMGYVRADAPAVALPSVPVQIVQHPSGPVLATYRMVAGGDHVRDQRKLYVEGGAS